MVRGVSALCESLSDDELSSGVVADESSEMHAKTGELQPEDLKGLELRWWGKGGEKEKGIMGVSAVQCEEADSNSRMPRAGE